MNRRHRSTEEFNADLPPVLVTEKVIEEIIKEPVKPVKEVPEWKRILAEKKATKLLPKEVVTKQPEIVIEKEITKSEDTKLALIGTTNTATTFRSIVKKKRLTITEVLEKLLTTYNAANK